MTEDRMFTQSELATFKRCRRQWWLAYFRRLRPRRDDLAGARALGSRVHDVLEAYYSPSDFTVTDAAGALDAWDHETSRLLAAAEGRGPDVYTEVRRDADLGRAMLEGYFAWVEEEGADLDLEVVAAERAVRVPFLGYESTFRGRVVYLLGKLDLSVLVRSTGARRFLDFKTVGSLGDLPERADIDEQFLHYSLLDYLDHLQTGEPAWADGGIWSMLRKVKRTARAKPPFYGRHDVRHSVDKLRSYWTRVAGTIADVESVERRLRDGAQHLSVVYPTPTRDCSWDCDFRSVCPMFDDPREDAEGYVADVYEVGDPLERYAGTAAGTEAN